MTISYFGYGSLVNIDTLPDGVTVRPGRLTGWRREWRIVGRDPKGQGRCGLTVRRQPDCEIWGVLASEPRAGLAVLEARESLYRKVDGIAPAFRCDAAKAQGPEDLFLFEAQPENRRWGDENHPVLQTYLDCVLAGFHRIWGVAGIHHFFETTDGWHVPVLKDRHAPLYPRAIQLEDGLRQLIDAECAARSLNFIEI